MTTKYEVVHPNLHLAVAGKLQHVPKGKPVSLTDSQAKRLGAKVKRVADDEALDVASSESASAATKAAKAAKAAAAAQK